MKKEQLTIGATHAELKLHIMFSSLEICNQVKNALATEGSVLVGNPKKIGAEYMLQIGCPKDFNLESHLNRRRSNLKRRVIITAN